MTNVQESPTKKKPLFFGIKWKEVPNIEGLIVSNYGHVRGKDREGSIQWLTQHISKKGYSIICYKYKQYRVHRLVGFAFIPNPKNKPEINHLDGNKLNNHYKNLAWSTSSENNRHSYHVLDNDSQYIKREVLIYKDGELYKTAISVRHAARLIKGASTNISKCCNGLRKTHKGYTFRYSDEMAKQV